MGDNSLSAQLLVEALEALGAHLAVGRHRSDLVVIGGSALLALGLVARPARDVDVVALVADGQLVPAEPLPTHLVEARNKVALDFSLSDDWLNAGPSKFFESCLPDGLLARLEARRYGPALTIRYPTRLDQIYFKLSATVDREKHQRDLRELRPTLQELLTVAQWAPYRIALRIRVYGHNGLGSLPTTCVRPSAGVAPYER